MCCEREEKRTMNRSEGDAKIKKASEGKSEALLPGMRN